MDNALIGGVAGVTLPPRMPIGHPERMPATEEAESRAAGARYIDEGDPHLRSAREVTGYSYPRHRRFGRQRRRFPDRRGGLGHSLSGRRYRHWLSGRKVLIAPPWVSEVSWATQEVQVTLTRAEIEASPEYNPDMVLDRVYEEQLHSHYGRRGYW